MGKKKNIPGIKYLAIMNPDVVLDEKTLENLTRFLSDHDDVAIVAPLIIESNRKTTDSMGWKLWSKKEVIRSAGYLGAKRVQKKSEGELVVEGEHIIHYIDVVKGCFFVTKLEPLIKMELLDEDTFMYGEEEILAYKVKKNNLKEAVIIDQYCYHNHVKTAGKVQISKIQEHIKRTYKSRRILLKKFYGAGTLELLRYDLAVFMNVYVLSPLAYYVKKLVR